MKRKIQIAVACLVLLVVSGTVMAETDVQTILDNRENLLNEVVVVQGSVEQKIKMQIDRTTDFYLLTDAYGAGILIRTADALPSVGDEIQVEGVISYDPNTFGIGGSQVPFYFISEESRISLGDEDGVTEDTTDIEMVPPIVPPDTTVANADTTLTIHEETETEESGLPSWLIPAILALAAVIIALVVILLLGKKKDKEKSKEVKEKEEEEEEDVITGKTIVIHAPPPGTLKVLPGRFEVTAGDEAVKEIRFFKDKNQVEVEITFGRESSTNKYSHIRLNSQTVSRRQAKLVFTNNKYVLYNFSTVNNTTVNNKKLDENGSVDLKSGDKITMGEVEFVYHA